MIGCSHNESCSEMDILMFTGKSIYPWAIIYMDICSKVVDCGLWSVGPLLFNGWILAGPGTRCRSRASQTCSVCDMSGEYAGHARTDVFSFQELCTDPFNMGSCIIMVQHEVMFVAE